MRILIANEPEKTKTYRHALESLGAFCLCTREPGAADTADAFDGLLLPGGDDVDPALYHEANHGSRTIDRDLDLFQLDLCRKFTAAGKPVLGICKGCQVINIAFGGDLIQDLPDGIREHHTYHPGLGTGEFHLTKAEPGSFMARLYGEEFVTNSYHHQAVGRIAEGFRCIQRSDDGVMECMVHTSLPVIAVQWHPEKNFRETAVPEAVDGEPLFRYFLSLFGA